MHFLPEILSGCATPAVIGAYAAGLFGFNPLLGGAVVLSVLYSGEAALAFSNKWYFSWRLPLLFLLRDAMLPVVYFDAWLVNDFIWRGNEMTMREEERPST
jgi:ceramide glucosyltransferase